ncbi:MAG: carbohydrate binding domain-containing protein [Burkholderiaceae bacterium]|nr:carbohydrate binding domain-containing protein [Burkholderiaceae bacterium]
MVRNVYFVLRYVLFSVIIIGFAPCFAIQLLENPGFEGGGVAANRCGSAHQHINGIVATGWVDNSCWTGAGTRINYALDTNNPHKGNSSQRITLESGSVQFASYPTNILSTNTAYNVSLWMRSDSAMQVSITLAQTNAPYVVYGTQSVTLSKVWTRYNFVAPAQNQQSWLLVQTSTPGTFWVDDASVLSNTELLRNPSFEAPAANTASCNSGSTTIAGTIANGWSCWGSNSGVAATFSLDSTVAHSGAVSQLVNIKSLNGGALYVQQYGNFKFQSGVQYTASVWLKSNSSSGIQVQIGLNTSDGATVFSSIRANVTDVWTQFILNGFTSQSPDGTSARLFLSPLQAGSIWIDDASVSGQPIAQAATPAVPIANSYFGLHIHSAEGVVPYARLPFGGVSKIPYGARRLWGTPGATWATIATCPSGGCTTAPQYNWVVLDAIVAHAASAGYDLIMNLGSSPQWASARPNEPSPLGYGQSAEPASMQIWQAWVNEVGIRYNGKIKYWEIWNEPTFPGMPPSSHENQINPGNKFYTGTPQTLFDLQKAAFMTLKSINPENKIFTPAIDSLDYLSCYVGIGGTSYADVLVFHFFANGAPELIYQYWVANVAAVVNNSSYPIPVWNTEGGWLTGSVPLGAGLQAAYLARAYILNWAAGNSRYYFYAWDEMHGLGVLTLQDYGVTPAGNAYYWIRKWLLGNIMSELSVDVSGNWIVTLSLPAGGTSHIVWNPKSNMNFVIPGGWQANTVQAINGMVASTRPHSTIGIGLSPVLIQ